MTDEEKAEEERRAAEEHIAKEATREAEREHREAVEMAEKLARWEEWVSLPVSARARAHLLLWGGGARQSH